ncbi:hypothetical protein TSUD_112730 [Trifolium subterraneum]|uniref:Uncharacterized protein n=1 Tax=Trifolium subterraneum TaxID=3900 RepID=A0A2Z6LG04_TRISU|nr:hypothetical protein TSUD_112730 [Trifolium subterraneum]
MVHQWGPAQCRVSHFKCRNTPAHDKFRVHGLWPSNFSDPQPRGCSLLNKQDEYFDMKKVINEKNLLPPTLVAKLRISWPSLIGRDEAFWKNQWRNHGTCSFSKFGQAQYFELGNSLWENMDLFDILEKEGIAPAPGKMYDQNDIIQAIKKHQFEGQVAIKPEFHCRGSELLEIRLCINHDGINYINCTSVAASNRGSLCGQKFEWFI